MTLIVITCDYKKGQGMKKFFSFLRYSFGNEDWRTEEEALDIQPKDQVLCITASGDRPLNLLTRECQKIICIDANQVQNDLLHLKVAAIKALDYPEYLAFLGALPSKNRIETLEKLLPHMDQQAGEYWKKHKKIVSKGIIYQGALERLLKFSSLLFFLFKGKKVKRLFAMNNIEEQRKFLREEWDTYLMRKCFNIILNTFLSRLLIQDPGLINFSSDIKPGNYIYDRMNASLENELAKKNPLLSLILRGNVSQEAFSPYLTEDGLENIKPRLSALEVHTMDILKYMELLPEPKFDVFSLSDVASYLSYPDFIRLLKGVIKTAKPGARFCLRQFMSSYEIPQNLQMYFHRDKNLEKRLDSLDNCFLYRFMAGTISSSPISKHGSNKKHPSLCEMHSP